MVIVNDSSAIKARTVLPSDNGYLMLAAEVDRFAPFRRPSAIKRKLLDDVKLRLSALALRDGVVEATLFRAVLLAPGEGIELIRRRVGKVHRARYDVVLLIRTTRIEAAQKLRRDPQYEALAEMVQKSARYTMQVVARNAVRLGEVDHRPDHVYLFNYFYAADRADLVPVFEYTAGWFQAKTGLTNSTLLEPLEGEVTDNGIINHASWPGFLKFLPSLIFRPTFRRFVLATFAANHIAAQPILYRRV